MAKLKIEALPNDKPVKVSLELPAQLHRDLLAYARNPSSPEWASHQQPRQVDCTDARAVHGYGSSVCEIAKAASGREWIALGE
jgi:hypothetical protein